MKDTYSHWSLLPERLWDKDRWPNFTPKELSCNHCGEYHHWPEFLDILQELRNEMEQPLFINSAHRCSTWNAMVGGAPLSQHKKLAVDISLRNVNNPKDLFTKALLSGFTGFGFYNTFLHLDLGRPRAWPSKQKRNPQWL